MYLGSTRVDFLYSTQSDLYLKVVGVDLTLTNFTTYHLINLLF